MSNTKITLEIWVTTPDKVGALAKVTAPVAEAKVNVWGLCAWADRDEKTGNFMLLTDNNTRAVEALKKAGFKTEEREVVVTTLEDEPGTCWNAANNLAQAGVDINYWYYTTCGGDCPGRIVLSTKDNKKAVSVLG